MTLPLPLDPAPATFDDPDGGLSRRRLLRAAAGTGAGVALLGVGWPESAEAALTKTGQVYQLVNQHRQAAGRRPLALHVNLTKAAIAHSQDQARMLRMTHTGSDGSDPGTRILRAGYRWGAWGENVAAGQESGTAVMQAWMNSSGHRANILNSNFIQMGVSYVRGRNGVLYWTLVLARGTH